MTRTAIALLTATAFLFGSPWGFAQQANENQLVLEEVLVTARKRTETLQDVPFSISAVTEREMRNRGMDTIEDIARNVASFTVQNLGPGQSQVAIRGASAGQVVRDQPGVKEQVGVYLDESVISMSLFTPDIDLYDMNRVEVLRGPQGTNLGRDSVGGAVMIWTKRPQDEFGGDITATTGSYDRRDVRASVNHLRHGSEIIEHRLGRKRGPNDGDDERRAPVDGDGSRCRRRDAGRVGRRRGVCAEACRVGLQCQLGHAVEVEDGGVEHQVVLRRVGAVAAEVVPDEVRPLGVLLLDDPARLAVGDAVLGGVAAHALVERVAGMFAVGTLGMMVGSMWHWVFPINKGLWTGSYVLFTAGMACVALATIMWLVDVQNRRRWTKPAVIYGMNPMVAFVGSAVMARLIYSILRVDYNGQSVSLQNWIYQTGFASWLSPMNASLAFAVAFVTFWYAVLAVLYKRKIFYRV